MAGCQPCQAFIATLEATIEQCRALGQEGPPLKVAKLRQEILEQYYKVNCCAETRCLILLVFRNPRRYRKHRSSSHVYTVNLKRLAATSARRLFL